MSGVGKQKKISEQINKYISKDKFDYEITYTRAPKHAIELAREASQKGYDMVIAVGGDGSVNEVGSGLLGSDTAMGIIPTGSGNGLARHLKIPQNIPGALKLLNHARPVNIDTVELNGIKFLGIAGIGFDALIAHKFASYGKRGFWSYLKIVMNEFKSFQERKFQLKSDNIEVEKQAFLISIANSSQFGNNACISPEADIQDGLIDVCILKKMPLIKVFQTVVRLFNNTIHQSAFIEIIRCSEITIEGNSSGLVHLDGEPFQIDGPLHFKVIPSSLKVLIPG